MCLPHAALEHYSGMCIATLEHRPVASLDHLQGLCKTMGQGRHALLLSPSLALTCILVVYSWR